MLVKLTYGIIFYACELICTIICTFQPVAKKGGVVKSGTNKKTDGVPQVKASKSVEPPEDVEVN